MQAQVTEHMTTSSVGSGNVRQRDDSIETPNSAQVQVLNSL